MNQRVFSNPAFYDPENAAKWNYRADQQKVFEAAVEAKKKFKIKQAGGDRFKIHLLLIDLQKDFCLPQGNLYVGGRDGLGAIKDNQRIAEFIYRNLELITEVTATMDTHFAYQIFFAPFWVNDKGESAAPYTIISVDDIRKGKYVPNPAIAWWLCNGNYPWLLKQVDYYVQELEKAGKYQLFLWPPHCLIGDEGHALPGVIQEARLYQAFARGAQAWVEVKGGNPLTENYSVLKPEVMLRWDGNPLVDMNNLFFKKLIASDAIVIAGQAASHCVKSTIEDLLHGIKAEDPELAKKVYIMKDAMSAVAIPDGKGGFIADYTQQAEDALELFRKEGMNVVRSVDPVENWPGIKL